MNNNFVCVAIGNALCDLEFILDVDTCVDAVKRISTTLLTLWSTSGMCDFEVYQALSIEIDETYKRCLDRFYPLA